MEIKLQKTACQDKKKNKFIFADNLKNILCRSPLTLYTRKKLMPFTFVENALKRQRI